MQEKLSVLVLDKNQNSNEILKKYLEEFEQINEIHSLYDYNIGLEFIKQNKKNLIVFLDISENSKELQNILEQIKNLNAKFVFTSINISTDIIVKSFRLGAIELLPKPILKKDLSLVINNISNLKYDKQNENSKIITFFSNKGGIGKTTLAINLAVELAKETKSKVALIDLNLQLGDIATFLNLTPTFNVSNVITKIFKNEDVNITNFCEKYKDTSLYILSDPNYIEQSMSITPQQIEKLFINLKKEFNFIIIDMNSNIEENSLKILDLSDMIMFTSIVNIIAIRNAQRCFSLFNSRNYPDEKVKLIINRYMENEELDIKDIEEALSQKVYWKIPNNYFTIMEAINKGISVSEVNFNSNISLNFKEFASKISNDIIEQSIIQHMKI